MKMKSVRAVCLSLALACLPAVAGVNVAGLFHDNMVLQRDMEVPVWGGGQKGEKVTVAFAGATKETMVDDKGEWLLNIGPLTAGGPHEMTITQGAATTTLKNILVGEVWICAGQSNMQWSLATLKQYSPPEAKDETPDAKYPDIRFVTIGGTGATRTRALPGGSPPWHACTPEKAGELSAVGYFFGRELYQHLNVPIGLIVTAQGASPIRSWISAETMNANPIFKQTLEDYKTVPERRKLYDAKRAIYDAALAKSKAEGTPPPNSLYPGSFEGDTFPGPYFYGRVYPLAPFAMRGVIWYQGENEAINFANTPRPERPNNALTYKLFFPVLIAEWRTLWGRDFPFLYVQLAPIGGKPAAPGESSWAEVRDGQRQALKVKNTAMVVTTDICDSDLHPKKKVDVGKRLALCARALAYGEKLLYSGPNFEKVEFKDGQAIPSFTDVGGGLVAKDGPLKGFAIAGADRKFVWGDAEIKGNTVVVSSPQVPKPEAVRYAWAENPVGNLFNQEGFPASCFRTDDW